MIVFCFSLPWRVSCVVFYTGRTKEKEACTLELKEEIIIRGRRWELPVWVFLQPSAFIRRRKKKITIRFIFIHFRYIYVYIFVCVVLVWLKGGGGGETRNLQTKKKGHGFGPIWAQTVAVKKTFSQLIWLDCYLCYLAAADSRRRRPEKSFTSLLFSLKRRKVIIRKTSHLIKREKEKRIHTVAILALFFLSVLCCFSCGSKGGKKRAE